jgi:hypothetical protein
MATYSGFHRLISLEYSSLQHVDRPWHALLLPGGKSSWFLGSMLKRKENKR